MHRPGTSGLEGRLDAVQQQLAQVQELLVGFSQKLEQQRIDTNKVTEGIQNWVTDYVSLRLQELVRTPVKHARSRMLRPDRYLLALSVRCPEGVVESCTAAWPIPLFSSDGGSEIGDSAPGGEPRVDVDFFARRHLLTFRYCPARIP